MGYCTKCGSTDVAGPCYCSDSPIRLTERDVTKLVAEHARLTALLTQRDAMADAAGVIEQLEAALHEARALAWRGWQTAQLRQDTLGDYWSRLELAQENQRLQAVVAPVRQMFLDCLFIKEPT